MSEKEREDKWAFKKSNKLSRSLIKRDNPEDWSFIRIYFFDRAVLLSHFDFYKDNLTSAIKILLSNDFPLNLIFTFPKKRLYSLFHSKLNTVSGKSLMMNDMLTSDEKNGFFTIPFAPSLSANIVKSLKNMKGMNLSFSFKNTNSLKKFIRVHKNNLDYGSQCNVIYRSDCSSCDASYVGQTGRKLCTKISEHQCNFSLNSNRHSVVSRHRSDSGHDFYWKDVKILDTKLF